MDECNALHALIPKAINTVLHLPQHLITRLIHTLMFHPNHATLLKPTEWFLVEFTALTIYCCGTVVECPSWKCWST